MTQTFECQSCGAPLDLPRDGSPAVHCSYCGRSVIIPAELRGNSPEGRTGVPERPGSELLKEIDRLIVEGNKIAAIKQYKDATGRTLIGPGMFKDARSIAVDPDGNIYVGEYSGGRVQVFDAQGKFITQWLVDLELPLRGLAVDRQGIIYFNSQGKFLTRFGSAGDEPGQFRAPGSIAFEINP